MLIQSSHPHLVRGLDPYFTPPAAIHSLIAIETLPTNIWEPAAGNGAIVTPLLEIGNHNIFASDIHDYGTQFTISDYLTTECQNWIEAIITNPPFKLAIQFISKSLTEVPYAAYLLRTNFLESMDRFQFFAQHPPTRVHISSRRLPMMHRFQWTGPIAPSNTCHAWFIWDRRPIPPDPRPQLNWFDWQQHLPSNPIDPASIGF